VRIAINSFIDGLKKRDSLMPKERKGTIFRYGHFSAERTEAVATSVYKLIWMKNHDQAETGSPTPLPNVKTNASFLLR